MLGLLQTNLASYTGNGGRKTDWLKKIGISSRTWYKWNSQEHPCIRKKTSVRVCKFASIDVADLPKFIEESIKPSILENKSFPKFLDTYFLYSDISAHEKLILHCAFFLSEAKSVGLCFKQNISLLDNRALILDENGTCIKVFFKENLFFEIFLDGVLLCADLFNSKNIQMLIKFLYKRHKQAKPKKIITLQEQYESTI